MDDERLLAEISDRLRSELARTVPAWIEDSIRGRSGGAEVTSDEVERAAADAAAFVDACLEELFETDVDRQRTNPLAVLRAATAYPTAVLIEAGAPEVRRDLFSSERFPEDVFDLVPATFADVAPELAEIGFAWGAAKARVHRRRHS